MCWVSTVLYTPFSPISSKQIAGLVDPTLPSCSKVLLRWHCYVAVGPPTLQPCVNTWKLKGWKILMTGPNLQPASYRSCVMKPTILALGLTFLA